MRPHRQANEEQLVVCTQLMSGALWKSCESLIQGEGGGWGGGAPEVVTYSGLKLFLSAGGDRTCYLEIF